MRSRYVFAGAVTIVLLLVSIALLQVVSANDPGGWTKSWVGPSSGDWSNAANWSGGTLPGPSDSVYIGPGNSVAISTGTQSITWLHSDSPLTISGGTLSISSTTVESVIESSLALSGGALTGAGDLTIDGLFTWALPYGGSAPMSGTGVTTANGGISISSGWYINLSRTLNNGGTATFSGGYHFTIDAGGVFNNLASATFNYGTDAFIQGSGAFNNYGTFNRTTSTGTGPIYCPFNNSGTVNVQSGTLSFRGTGTHTGALNVESGATLDFNSGTIALNAGSSVSGAGATRFSGATVTVAGTYNPSGPTTISDGTANFNSNVTPNALTLSGGVLSGSGNVTIGGLFTWALPYGGSAPMGGTGVTTANGGISISSGWYINLSRTLNNAGTATFSGGYDFNIEAGGAFNNLAGATFDYSTNVLIQGSGAFNNYGTFNRTTSTGTGPIYCPFNNSGTVNVQSGTLSFRGTGAHTGLLNVDSGATLDFNSGTIALNSGSSVNGAGAVTFTGATVTVEGTYNPSGPTTISYGTVNFNSNVTPNALTLSGGVLSGSGNVTIGGLFTWALGFAGSAPMTGTGETTANGGISMSSGWYMHLYRTLNNAGTATFSGGYDFNIEAGGAFNNLAGATFDYSTNVLIQGSGAFNNYGTFNRTTSTGTGLIYCPFNNSGTVNVNSGTLSFQNAFTQTAGSIVLNGGSVTTSNPLDIQGGSLKGSGSITGNVSIGASGAVDIELGGTIPGTGASNYDQLNISGSATLAGTLNVTLTGGFTPAIGNTFTIMTFGSSYTGTFATTNLPALGSGRAWGAVGYSSGSVVLSVVAGSNHAPAAVNDAYSTNEDTALSQAALGVLANDTDSDADPLTAILVSNVSHGTLVLNANGSFTYTPAANHSGSDSFTYKVNDGTTDSTVATVTITVNAVNDAPAAPTGGSAYSTDVEGVLNQAAPGVLANVTDADGNPLTAVLVSNVSHGTLVLNADGSFTYTPADGFTGTDSFTCKANDGTADSSVFTVTIEVTQGEPPTITSLSKTSGSQGKRLTMVITGTNLGEATALDFGVGITVGTPTATSPTEITVEITIDSDAALGARDVVVTTPEGIFTLEDGFMVENAKSGGAPVWVWPVMALAVVGAAAAAFFLFFLLPRRKAKQSQQ